MGRRSRALRIPRATRHRFDQLARHSEQHVLGQFRPRRVRAVRQRPGGLLRRPRLLVRAVHHGERAEQRHQPDEPDLQRLHPRRCHRPERQCVEQRSDFLGGQHLQLRCELLGHAGERAVVVSAQRSEPDGQHEHLRRRGLVRRSRRMGEPVQHPARDHRNRQLDRPHLDGTEERHRADPWLDREERDLRRRCLRGDRRHPHLVVVVRGRRPRSGTVWRPTSTTTSSRPATRSASWSTAEHGPTAVRTTTATWSAGSRRSPTRASHRRVATVTSTVATTLSS